MKKVFWVLMFLIVVIPVALYLYFKNTDAPILQGNVDINVEYKKGLALDIYQPTNDIYSKRPVLIYYHGGAWVTGSKITVNNDRFHATFNALREKGYTIISPDYTLAEFKESPFPNCIADAFDVITWIENNASTYNLDTDNVGVLGESAGGHLALMVAYADIEKFTKPNNIILNYVVGIYPPTDLGTLHNDHKEMRSRVNESTASLPESMKEYFSIDQYLYGFDSDKDTLKARQISDLCSPIRHVTENSPSTLLIHGNKDRVVPISQSTSLKEKMDSVGHGLSFHTLDGVDHAFMNATTQQNEQTQTWIINFVTSKHKSSDFEN